MATVEEKQELEMKIQDTFQQVQSKSVRCGYQMRCVVDPESLQELLEKIVDAMVTE